MINEHVSDINISAKQFQETLWNIDCTPVKYCGWQSTVIARSADLSVFYSFQSYNLDIYEVDLQSLDLWQPMEQLEK